MSTYFFCFRVTLKHELLVKVEAVTMEVNTFLINQIITCSRSYPAVFDILGVLSGRTFEQV